MPSKRTALVDAAYARALIAGYSSIILARTHIATSSITYAQFTKPGNFEHDCNPDMGPTLILRDAVAHRVSHVNESFGLVSKLAKYKPGIGSNIKYRNSIGGSELTMLYGTDFRQQDVTAAALALGRLKQRGFDLDAMAAYRNELAHETHFPDFTMLWNEVMLPTGKLEFAKMAIEGEIKDTKFGIVLRDADPAFATYRATLPKVPKAKSPAEHDASVVAALRKEGRERPPLPQDNDDLL